MSFDINFSNQGTNSASSATNAKPLFTTKARGERIRAMARRFTEQQPQTSSAAAVATLSLATATAQNTSANTAQRGAKRQATTSETGKTPTGFIVSKNVYNLRKPPAQLPQWAIEQQRRMEQSRTLLRNRPLPALPQKSTVSNETTQNASSSFLVSQAQAATTTTVTPTVSRNTNIQKIAQSLATAQPSTTARRPFLRAVRKIDRSILEHIEVIRFGKPSKKAATEEPKAEETAKQESSKTEEPKAEKESKNELTHPTRAVIGKRRRRMEQKLKFKT